jgi:type IV secretory pathway VirB6-like protein
LTSLERLIPLIKRVLPSPFAVFTGAITAFKIISIAIASIIWAASCGHTLADLGPIMESNIAVIGLLYTGLVTTAAALWVQSYAFEEVSEHKNTV